MAFEEFYQNIYPTLFEQWISLNCSQYKSDHVFFHMSHPTPMMSTLSFELDYVIGTINIYKSNIIEEYIQNNNGDQLFYLHFSIIDLNQACQLFYDFYHTLIKHNNYSPPHIAICCSGGLSTSIFVDEMKTICEQESFPIQLTSLSFDELLLEYNNFDAIFLAPQIADQLPYLKTYTHKPIYLIDVVDYATKNYRAIVQFINDIFKHNK